MLGLQSVRSYPQARFALRDRKHAVSEKHTPGQNHLLAALPRADLERLLPDLEHVSLPMGETLYGPGDRQRHLYFITAGIVARLYLTERGASAGFAVTGSEGVVGVASFLSGETMPSEAVVLSAGYAYRLGGILLRHEFEHGGPLQRLLLRYTHALIAQTAQTVACNRHHSVEQQLCRWLLLSLDRLPSNEVTMTQEVLANMLGVRRESVTDAASKLQTAGLIRYGRGHIVVLNRPRLEAQACECYAAVKRAYVGLLDPESISGSAGVHGGCRHNVSVGEGIAQPELT